MAAPRQKRSRSQSPPSSPAIASPLDQLVKRRARQFGKSPLAKDDGVRSEQIYHQDGLNGYERRPKRRRKQGPSDNQQRTKRYGIESDGTQDVVNGSGKTASASTMQLAALQRTPENAISSRSQIDLQPSFARTTSEPATISHDQLVTPAPSGTRFGIRREDGGGRPRVQRVSSLWNRPESSPNSAPPSGSGSPMAVEKASPLRSPYAESNALLHQLHLARLQPRPSPSEDTILTSSPMQTPSRTPSGSYFPDLGNRLADQSINAGRSVHAPPDGKFSPSRYPYLSRERATGQDDMDSSSVGSSDIDEDQEDEVEVHTPGKNMTSGSQSDTLRRAFQSPSLSDFQAARTAVSRQQPHTPHRSQRPPSSNLSFTSSRLANGISSPRPRVPAPAPRIPTPHIPRSGPVRPQPPVQPPSLQAIQEAEETKRVYEEANRLLGGLVVGRRAQTEIRPVHHGNGRP